MCSYHLVEYKKSSILRQLNCLRLSHPETTKARLQGGGNFAPGLVVSQRDTGCLVRILEVDSESRNTRSGTSLVLEALLIRRNAALSLSLTLSRNKREQREQMPLFPLEGCSETQEHVLPKMSFSYLKKGCCS